MPKIVQIKNTKRRFLVRYSSIYCPLFNTARIRFVLKEGLSNDLGGD